MVMQLSLEEFRKFGSDSHGENNHVDQDEVEGFSVNGKPALEGISLGVSLEIGDELNCYYRYEIDCDH
jgi:hypothetical protein